MTTLLQFFTCKLFSTLRSCTRRNCFKGVSYCPDCEQNSAESRKNYAFKRKYGSEFGLVQKHSEELTEDELKELHKQ